MTRVIDTNVPLVVKFRDQHPQELVDACEEILEEILTEALPVVIDQGDEILEEYFHKMDWSGAPSLADAFARYVHDYHYSWPTEMRPDIEPEIGTADTYAVLGGDDSEIDPSDRKFVAAAKVAGRPVVEAADTKWLDWGPVLARHGVRVIFAHEDSIRTAYRNKFGREAP